jgi:NAD(P)-dependent dehydrogenase (short-subunit alcohol dehydrogenase family)
VGPLALAQPETVTRQFQTNAFGPLLLIQLLLPAMRAQGAGRIVSVGTVVALTPLPLLGLYSSSKAAAAALTDALRLECHSFGIRAITVIPGTVRTNFDHAALARTRAQHHDERAPYRQAAERMEEMLGRSTTRGMPPSLVAQRIAHALETRRPRSCYLVGLEGRLLYHGLPWLPRTVRDLLLRRSLGL